MPIEENEKFLDVSLDVPSYNCGLFKFDWELLMMVINYFRKLTFKNTLIQVVTAESIYLITLTQFQKTIT
jgi:hypothetical protein